MNDFGLGFFSSGGGSSSLPSALTTFLGTWNADTNTPTITSGVGSAGEYYKVTVAGTTNIDGLNSWSVGDYIWYSGATSTWQKLSGGGSLPYPSGVDKTIQFNDAGTLGGDANLTWDKTGQLLNVIGKTQTDDLKIDNLTSVNNLGTDAQGNVVDKSNILLFDATIGDAGADYSSISAAIAAGKKYLKLIDNLTLGANYTLTADITIFATDQTLEIRSNTFYIDGAFKLTVRYLTLKGSTVVGAFRCGLDSDYCILDNTSAVGTQKFLIYPENDNDININNFVLKVNNNSQSGISLRSTTTARTNINNCEVIGAGTSSSACIDVTGITATAFVSISNIYFTGTFSTSVAAIRVYTSTTANLNVFVDKILLNHGNYIASFYGGTYSNLDIYKIETGANTTNNVKSEFSNVKCTLFTKTNQTPCNIVNLNIADIDNLTGSYLNVTNLYIHSSGNLATTLSNFTNFYTYGNVTITGTNNYISNLQTKINAIDISITGNYNVINGGYIIGDLSIAANYCKADNLDVTLTTTVNGDYNKLTDNNLTGAATLSAGSEYNVITGNLFTGGLTNSSGNTTNEINNNI